MHSCTGPFAFVTLQSSAPILASSRQLGAEGFRVRPRSRTLGRCDGRISSFGDQEMVLKERRIRFGCGSFRVLRGVCRVNRDEGESYVASTVEKSDVVVVESEEISGQDGDGEASLGWLSTHVKARLYLLLVPFMWGTYGPALRFIYSQPMAPSASIITLSRKGMCHVIPGLDSLLKDY